MLRILRYPGFKGSWLPQNNIAAQGLPGEIQDQLLFKLFFFSFSGVNILFTQCYVHISMDIWETNLIGNFITT